MNTGNTGFLQCSCKVNVVGSGNIGVPNSSVGITIEYCAKHGAVDALLEAAEEMEEWVADFFDIYGFDEEQMARLTKLRAAIRRARGEA